MSIEHLKTFLVVYRAGTMRRAAELLAMTQPTVSQQIAVLEHQLGAQLFVRSRRGVNPTPMADGLAREIAKSIDALDYAVESRRANLREVTGLVHIAAASEFFSVYGARLVSAFRDSPLRLEMHVGNKEFLYQGLEDGNFNMAIMAQHPDESRFACHQLGEEKLLLLAHPDLLQDLRGRPNLNERLKELPLIANSRDLLLTQRYWQEVFNETPEITPKVIMPNLRNVARVCAETPAWTVLPDIVVGEWLKTGTLQNLKPEASVSTPLYLTWQRSAMRTSRIAFAVERIKHIWHST